MKILITGTTSGIGRTIALYLASMGHEVIGTSRSSTTDDDLPVMKLDVTDDLSVNNCIDLIKKKYGALDLLINNAGFALAGPIEETSISEAVQQFETNYFGVVRMIKGIIPLMRSNGGGLIINISSMAGLMALPFQGHYSASKFALEGLVEALRIELMPFKIKVVNINPGDFSTNIASNRKISDTYEKRFRKTLKLYEKDEQSGADPIIIAHLIERLINKKTGHKVRYSIGNFTQTVTIPLKKILSSKLFEKMLIKTYKLDQ